MASTIGQTLQYTYSIKNDKYMPYGAHRASKQSHPPATARSDAVHEEIALRCVGQARQNSPLSSSKPDAAPTSPGELGFVSGEPETENPVNILLEIRHLEGQLLDMMLESQGLIVEEEEEIMTGKNNRVPPGSSQQWSPPQRAEHVSGMLSWTQASNGQHTSPPVDGSEEDRRRVKPHVPCCQTVQPCLGNIAQESSKDNTTQLAQAHPTSPLQFTGNIQTPNRFKPSTEPYVRRNIGEVAEEALKYQASNYTRSPLCFEDSTDDLDQEVSWSSGQLSSPSQPAVGRKRTDITQQTSSYMKPFPPYPQLSPQQFCGHGAEAERVDFMSHVRNNHALVLRNEEYEQNTVTAALMNHRSPTRDVPEQNEGRHIPAFMAEMSRYRSPETTSRQTVMHRVPDDPCPEHLQEEFTQGAHTQMFMSPTTYCQLPAPQMEGNGQRRSNTVQCLPQTMHKRFSCQLDEECYEKRSTVLLEPRPEHRCLFPGAEGRPDYRSKETTVPRAQNRQASQRLQVGGAAERALTEIVMPQASRQRYLEATPTGLQDFRDEGSSRPSFTPQAPRDRPTSHRAGGHPTRANTLVWMPQRNDVLVAGINRNLLKQEAPRQQDSQILHRKHEDRINTCEVVVPQESEDYPPPCLYNRRAATGPQWSNGMLQYGGQHNHDRSLTRHTFTFGRNHDMDTLSKFYFLGVSQLNDLPGKLPPLGIGTTVVGNTVHVAGRETGDVSDQAPLVVVCQPEVNNPTNEATDDLFPAIALNTPIGALRRSRKRMCLMLNIEQEAVEIENLTPDYRGLADLLGYELFEILNFWPKNPSKSLFIDWARCPEKNPVLWNLSRQLKILGRQDILEDCHDLILEDVSDHIAEQNLLNYYAADRLEAFDCYVNIADEDLITIGREILDKLEGVYGLRLCFTLRDVNLGSNELEEMATMLERRCRKVLLVLSKNYENSEACVFLMHFAVTLDPTARENKLVPLVVDEGINIPCVLRSRSMLNYRRDAQNRLLWPRLNNAIKP